MVDPPFIPEPPPRPALQQAIIKLRNAHKAHEEACKKDEQVRDIVMQTHQACIDTNLALNSARSDLVRIALEDSGDEPIQ